MAYLSNSRNKVLEGLLIMNQGVSVQLSQILPGRGGAGVMVVVHNIN